MPRSFNPEHPFEAFPGSEGSTPGVLASDGAPHASWVAIMMAYDQAVNMERVRGALRPRRLLWMVWSLRRHVQEHVGNSLLSLRLRSVLRVDAPARCAPCGRRGDVRVNDDIRAIFFFFWADMTTQ